MLRWSIIIIVYAVLAYYTFELIKVATKSNWIAYIFLGVSILIMGNFVFHFLNGPRVGVLFSDPNNIAKAYSVGFFVALMVFQGVAFSFIFMDDVLRFISVSYQRYLGTSTEFSLSSRRRFLSVLGLGLASIPFSVLLYGMYRGKYNYKVLRYELEFDDLPDSFDGYRITQISDIHCGSFDNRDRIRYGVDLINQQRSDVIVFTGDMVNNTADELIPWKSIFSELEAPDGKYSVLGNHDYGDYIQWESKRLKSENLDTLLRYQKEMGFEPLLNESRYLNRGADRIALVGVENWGRGFKQVGDLEKASVHIDRDDFKILMSHDPTHWEDRVLKSDTRYQLTLSGHTHGMQMGIEIPGWVKWSPIKRRYKHWAGIYGEPGEWINVNRGFGYFAFPGRVGIWPEITVITLKKRSLT
jgi:predicted MPP superfamily phosphohydrolase